MDRFRTQMTLRPTRGKTSSQFDPDSATMRSGGEERISRAEWFKHHTEQIQNEDPLKFEKFSQNLKEYFVKEVVTYAKAEELAGITKEQLRQGLALEDDTLFEILYSLICPSSRDRVDIETVIVMMYVFMRNNDSVEKFSFQLFSTQPQLQPKGLYKREFSEMIITMVDNDLMKLLDIPKAKDAFFAHLQKEHSEELFIFNEQISMVLEEPQMKVEKARVIFKTYLEVGGQFEINVSDPLRKSIEEKIEEAEASRQGKEQVLINTDIFAPAREEIIEMMNGGFQRFKRRVVKEESLFVDVTWKFMKVKKKQDIIPFDKFVKWQSKKPGMFKFVDTIQTRLLQLYGAKIGSIGDIVKK